MNSETLFSMALGLQAAWQFKDVTFTPDASGPRELHLHIDFVSGSRFPDETNELFHIEPTILPCSAHNF